MVSAPAPSARTVCLVHGAWHDAWCWRAVVERLEAIGVRVVAPDLPLRGLAGDVAAVEATLAGLDGEVVLVGHSYGGLVVSHAAAGSAGVAHLVYLAAFMLEPDEDPGALLAAHGGELGAALRVVDGDVTVDPERAAALFYGDSPPELAAAAVARLRPMAATAFVATPAEPAWRTIPATYVVCSEDRALPVSLQQAFAARATTSLTWPTDHSPFLSRPAVVASLLADLA